MLRSSQLKDAAGNLIADGIVSILPTLCDKQTTPTPFRVLGDSWRTQTPVPVKVLAGQFSVPLANTSQTVPRICYSMTVRDSKYGTLLIGKGYDRMQPSESAPWCHLLAGVLTCNVEEYDPNLVPDVPVGPAGPTGAQGPNGPKGDKGDAGPQGIPGTVVGKGDKGDQGTAATVAIGTIAALPPGSQPTVTNGGSSSAAVFNFGVPAGVPGISGAPGQPGSPGGKGDPGSAATVSIGAVAALPPGSQPTVTNGGSSSAAILNFGVPAGVPGTSGAPGQPGSSAYQVALANGFSGTQAQWLASLQGAPGAPGGIVSDGAVNASQTTSGSGPDQVAWSNTAINQVINAGPATGLHATFMPLFAGSVIHDTGVGTEGSRYFNCVVQSISIDVGNHCQWNHARFTNQTGAPTNVQSLRFDSLESWGPSANYQSDWRTISLHQGWMNVFNRGITNLENYRILKAAGGDINLLNLYLWVVGNWNTHADESTTGLRLYLSQPPFYYHGTSLSSGTGLTVPLLSDTTVASTGDDGGTNYTPDTAILMDISKGTIAGTITGPSVPLAGSGYLNTYPTSLTNLPVTTNWGICNTAFPRSPSPQINRDVTCTLTLNRGQFTAGDLVWFAQGEHPEQVRVSAAGAVSNGTQSVTFSMHNATDAGANVFGGGLSSMSQFLSMDANLAGPAHLGTSYYALASLDRTSLVYGYFPQGASSQLPGCGAMDFCAGVTGRNGFHLYPGAEILWNNSPKHDPQLETNAIPFSLGDLIVVPHPGQQNMYGIKMYCGLGTPSSPRGGSNCASVTIGGEAWTYGSAALSINSALDFTRFKPNGGPLDGGPAAHFTGYFDTGLQFDIFPGRALIEVDNMNPLQIRGDHTLGSNIGTFAHLPSANMVYNDVYKSLYLPQYASDTYRGPDTAFTGTCTAAQAGVRSMGGDTTTICRQVSTGVYQWVPFAKAFSYQPGLSGGLSALAAGTYPLAVYYNDTGQTITLTGIRCYNDTGASSVTLSRITPPSTTQTALLASPLTCSNAVSTGTQSATVTLAPGDLLKSAVTLDGTTVQAYLFVRGSYPGVN